MDETRRPQKTAGARPRRLRPLTGRRSIVGLTALAVLGSAGAATATPPDLLPFVSSEGTLRPERWYVDSSVDGGVYTARFHFPAQVANIGGTLKLTAGAPSGPAEAPLATAVQVVDGTTTVNLGPAVRLVGRRFGEGAYGWGVEGLARYTLTPSTGPALASALTSLCREDNAVFGEPGAPVPAPAAFAPAGTPIGGNIAALANCGPALPQTAVGFSAGISTGWQDVVDLNSANSAYFDVTGAAPGPGVFRAQVDPAGEIAQGGATGNDVELRPLDIPGVVATPKQAVLSAAGTASTQLAATVKEPQVRGRRVTAASPADGSDAAPAGAALRYLLAAAPAKGTVTINATTGQAVYTGNGGSTAADTFTYVAEDTRGLRSAPAQVFVDPPGSITRVGLGRPDLVRTILRKSRSLAVGRSASFKVRVPKGALAVTFATSWRSGTYSLRLRRPGAKVDARVGKSLKLTKGRTFRSFRAVNPKAGTWNLTVTRLKGVARLDTAQIRATLQLKG